MSLMNDDVLAARLRESVEDLALPGPGPDLHRIRRRGSARRRRHQIALAGSTAAALALATSLAVAATAGPDRLGSGYAGGQGDAAPAASDASDPTAVGEILDGVVEETGIGDPAMYRDQPDAAITTTEDPETGQQTGWAKRWSASSAQPKIVVSVAVYPEGWLAEQDYPCQQGNPDALRSCRDEVLSNGVRLLSGEDSSLTIVDDAGQWAMWSPSALAVYPDGRQVSISIGLRVEDGDQVSREGALQQPGPQTRISLEQLRAFVTHADLTRISLP